jgi:transposase
MKRFIVTLSHEERVTLRKLIGAGKAPARRLQHARILLKADSGPGGPGLSDPAVAEAVEASKSTVARVRRRYSEAGLNGALGRRPTRRVYQRKLGGVEEAHLVALACSAPPEGQTRWTLQLLADRMVALHIVDSISDQTVRRTLKNALKPWLKETCYGESRGLGCPLHP